MASLRDIGGHRYRWNRLRRCCQCTHDRRAAGGVGLVERTTANPRGHGQQDGDDATIDDDEEIDLACLREPKEPPARAWPRQWDQE